MKLKLLFAAFLFFITNIGVSQNLLTNGGFETGDKTGWTNGKNFVVQTVDINSGTYAGEISGDSYTNQPVTVTEGKTYRVHFFGKAAVASENAFLSVQYQNGTVWTYNNYVNIQSTSWQEYSFVVKIATGEANNFRVALRQYSGGEHYFDDIELTEIVDPSSLSSENNIISTTIGTLNATESKIEDVPLEAITAADLISALTLSSNATVVLISDTSLAVTPDTIIDGTETIKVFAEDGTAHVYTMTTDDSVIKSINSDEAEFDNVSTTISKITPVLTVTEFINDITLLQGATLEVLDAVAETVISNQGTTIISDSMIIRVTGASGAMTDFTLQLRAVETDSTIASIAVGTVNETTPAIEDIPQNIVANQLESLIEVATYASFQITDNTGTLLASEAVVTATDQVRVTAENGDLRIYQIVFGSATITNVTYTDQNVTETQLSYSNVTLEGTSELKITDATNALDLASVNINSEDSWLMFENILPSVVRDTYLKDVLAYGQPAVLDQNVRIVQYVNGAVVIPHAPDYGAVEIFDGPNLTGNSMVLTPYTYNKIAQLGVFNDAVASFKVKRGYYVTMAQNENGSGFSKVFLAHDADLTVNTMPNGLAGEVSFARVIPWRWPNKKGHPNNDSPKFNGGWKYNWNANGISTLDVEYVPIKHKISWPSLTLFKDKKDSPNMLGHNEPNAPEQANATIEQVLAQWPKLMESGLRLGSPAPTDGGLNSWLYPFIDRCDELNYRVDFVAIHYYRGCNTTNGQGIYNFAKAVHDRTGRPVWITEFSNGAPWSSCTPADETEHAAGLKEMIKRLEEAPFVERYCIFPYFWPFNKTLDSDKQLTENGIVYRDQVSNMAYNPAEAYDTTFEPLTPPNNLTATFDSNAEEVDLTWEITSDVEGGFKVERSIDGGTFEEIDRVEGAGITTYTDTDILFSGEYRYRVRSIIPAVANSGYSLMATTTVDLSLVNIAKDKAVTIHSNATGGYDHHTVYVPAGATDEDYTTEGRWVFRFDTNGGFPITLEIDLVDNYKISSYKMVEDNKATKSYKIQYLDATDNWVDTTVNVTNNSNLVTSGVFSGEPVTNKIRVVFNSSQDTQYIRLFEIELYGEQSSLSTDFNTLEKVALYPNPVKDNLIYVKGIPEITSATLYNIYGAKQEARIVGNKLEVGHLSTGLYVVIINNERVGKFIKQ
ncbi:glycosyl hydrolase [uncultured Algibacter sp.]|uniref:glycosyl hydrolase n=1 Tax=uncultured Algibacter sp. TaxID=298659 RepID=UPI00260F6F58|nr:glycosyl hydrolase [uncultured Algibacter sp.]